jgi:hypothetical protein
LGSVDKTFAGTRVGAVMVAVISMRITRKKERKD